MTADVKLIDEVIDVWRPVEAEHITGETYRIAIQPYDPETESWEFILGDQVVCELISTKNGGLFAATRRA